jgi:hypothetical protein
MHHVRREDDPDHGQYHEQEGQEVEDPSAATKARTTFSLDVVCFSLYLLQTLQRYSF